MDAAVGTEPSSSNLHPASSKKILFASVELSPIAKVGGLGDVAGSLPRALRAHGLDVRVAIPFHGAIDRTKLRERKILQDVRVAWPEQQTVDVWSADVRGVPVFLLENEHYFARPKVYGYDDDVERFLFFCDALLACAPHLGFQPDAIHAQDWHTAFLHARLAADASHDWAPAGRVYTIHNLAQQGAFDEEFAARFSIGNEPLSLPENVDPATKYSGMAQGIIHADRVNTVSRTYAKEIMTPEYGAGLDPLLRARAPIVSGIVNGIDYEEFDPATDPALVQNYDLEHIERRAANKHALLQRAGLPQRDDLPLFAAVTRLFPQKGIDLVAEAFATILESTPMQLVVLGTGDEAVHEMLLALQAKFPESVEIWIDFDPPLGQLIYAGCDVFLMPSRFEPCGLGQLISLRYGAIPLVRHTGGLVDTVEDISEDRQTGTGFVFEEASANDLSGAVRRAVAAFSNQPVWRSVQERGMRQDWSWQRAAGDYVRLYEDAQAARLDEMQQRESRA